MATKDQAMRLYLGKLKEPWEKYCEARDVKPGVALKGVVEKLLANEIKPDLIFKQVEGPDRGKKLRWEVPLTPSEKGAMIERAKHEGCSPRRWVVNLIRLALTHEPQYTAKELEVLGESNYQLYSIGRNLNQLAKRLNEGHLEPVTVKRIEELRETIKAHTETVNRTVGASFNRWNIK